MHILLLVYIRGRSILLFISGYSGCHIKSFAAPAHLFISPYGTRLAAALVAVKLNGELSVVMATARSPDSVAASEALRRLYADLVRVLQDPELLACDLYAEGIVPENALEEVNVVGITATQKRTKLLSFVKDQVGANAARLPEFIEVLKRQPPMVEVAERLERMHRE